MESKTWLSGISDLIAAINEPQRFGDAYAGRVLGAAVPTGVAQVARAVDPVQRDTKAPSGFDVPDWVPFRDAASSAAGRIQSRIPGLSDNLPARANLWGEQMVSEGGLGPDILSPMWLSTRKNDPIAQEMLAINARFGNLKKETDGIPHTPEQQATYAQLAGRYIYADITAAMADPEWATLPDEEKRKWVDDIKEGARRAAREELGLGQEASALPAGWEVVPN